MNSESMKAQERMEFIETLNKCMKDFDNNIERHMRRSDEMEIEAYKKTIKPMSRKDPRLRNRLSSKGEER